MSLRALKRGMVPAERPQMPVRFVCPECRQLGFGVCERPPAHERGGMAPTLISVSSGFSIRKAGGSGEILCGCCQSVVAL